MKINTSFEFNNSIQGLLLIFLCFFIQNCKKSDNKPTAFHENITLSALANDGGMFAFVDGDNLIRIDKNGSRQWYFENPLVQDMQILLKCPNDDVLMIGTEKVKDSLLVGYDFYHIAVKKVSAAGNLIWSNAYLGDNKFSYNSLNSAVLLPSGDICISSTNNPLFSSNPVCQLIKINTNGIEVHHNSYPGLPEVMLYNSDNNNLLMLTDSQIFKLDSSLKAGVPKTSTMPNIFNGFADQDGLLLHYGNGTVEKDRVPVIELYDLDGNFKFKKSYSTLKGYVINTINKGRNGHYLITGYQSFTEAGAHPTSDVMFMEIDASGNLLNNKSYAFDVRDFGYSVYNRTNDYLLVGRSEHSEYNQLFSSWLVVGQPVWMLLDENGNSK